MLRFFLVVFISLGSSLAQMAGGTEDNPLVLKVASSEIRLDEFNERFSFYAVNLAAQQGIPLTDDVLPLLQALKPAYVDQLIEEQVILQLARSRQLRSDDAFADQQLSVIRADFPSEEDFLEALFEVGLAGEQTLRILIMESDLIQQLIELLRSEIVIRDFQVQLYYDNNRDAFMGEAQACARHILLESLEDAEQVKAALKQGADFAELAFAESIDAGSGSRGGDLGCFGRGRMIPVFETAAFSEPIDAISEPVASQFGFHIIQVYARQDAEPVPLEQVRTAITQELQNDIIRQVITDYRAGLEIEVFEEALEDENSAD